MSEDTEKFCRDFGPFVAVQRFGRRLAMAGFAVRSRIGEDVAICDGEDQAKAIAEALNGVSGATCQVSGAGATRRDPHFWDKQ